MSVIIWPIRTGFETASGHNDILMATSAQLSRPTPKVEPKIVPDKGQTFSLEWSGRTILAMWMARVGGFEVHAAEMWLFVSVCSLLGSAHATGPLLFTPASEHHGSSHIIAPDEDFPNLKSLA